MLEAAGRARGIHPGGTTQSSGRDPHARTIDGCPVRNSRGHRAAPPRATRASRPRAWAGQAVLDPACGEAVLLAQLSRHRPRSLEVGVGKARAMPSPASSISAHHRGRPAAGSCARSRWKGPAQSGVRRKRGRGGWCGRWRRQDTGIDAVWVGMGQRRHQPGQVGDGAGVSGVGQGDRPGAPDTPVAGDTVRVGCGRGLSGDHGSRAAG